MSAEQEIRIANEFASVTVRKIRTRNGERLEIISNGLGLQVSLDPLSLESLTWQHADMYSSLLQTPLEPYPFSADIPPPAEKNERKEERESC
ncbi:dihydrodiol dehydrogenase [Paenibacillus lignilyticus]|uniref:Dihydrodiol dehydrogenase n=1 Tax=Paenibacillus lignilyticus TaxID=1172615 RepID=A0ABS5C5C7_9BACL|nr:dihydrodiol dehydrogenase [Paenibacillus lignilyticus]MBP3961180.1 dihydrodiol dehydrogenase [Paenibacillus lignilyticus]